MASINPNVIVVANSGGEFDVNPWIGSVKALIMAWYGGQEGGRALAAIISGAVSPSGRLPFTFWGSEAKNPAARYYHAAMPEVKKAKKNRDPFPNTQYSEGIFLGYRGVERFGVKPMFPFGYGLSYGSFEYSGGSVEQLPYGLKVSFTVKNTSKVTASEVAQVYVSKVDSKIPRPARELKGYEKVTLGKGESKTVSVTLTPNDFSSYSASSHDWVVTPGEYRIIVGDSSASAKIDLPVKL